MLRFLADQNFNGRILRGLEAFEPLSKEDAEVALGVVAENRADEHRGERDLH